MKPFVVRLVGTVVVTAIIGFLLFVGKIAWDYDMFLYFLLGLVAVAVWIYFDPKRLKKKEQDKNINQTK
jgi:membrane protein implicated in regulation of membrane protease activity